MTITKQHTMQQTGTTTNKAFWSLEMGLKAKQAKDKQAKELLQQSVANGTNITNHSFGNKVTINR